MHHPQIIFLYCISFDSSILLVIFITLASTTDVIQLSTKDLDDILKLYEISYPDNWFDPRMLETNQYYAIRNENNMLISTAGIHVYSSKYKVAALGNITTHPDFRGKGLAKITSAKLCKSL